MLSNIWNVVLYKPLLNALAFLVSIVPGGDVGVAVILLTLIVKIILYPLSKKSIESQAKLNVLTPELQKIKNSGLSKEEQAKKTMELYKEHKTNPFSGCLLLIIQIPIIFALYYVFLKGLQIDNGLLYSFVTPPANINTHFLGLIDIANKSMILAVLAGISQYLQAHFMPKPKESENKTGSFQENFTKSMHTQMKYVFPVIVVFISYSISGVVALYWTVSNIFAVLQQIYVNKKKVEVSQGVKN